MTIQRFIDAIESNDYDSIENYRDEISHADIPKMVEYYKSQSDWEIKTGCIEIMCDQSGSDLTDILLDYLRVPDKYQHDDRMQIAQATVLSIYEKSDNFVAYYEDRVLLASKVNELIEQHGLQKAQ